MVTFPQKPESETRKKGKKEGKREEEEGRWTFPQNDFQEPRHNLAKPSPASGVRLRRRQRVGGGVRSSLLSRNLVAAVYSLSLISELCHFGLHSGFSNLSIFLVLTELSSPEPSNLDLCSWGGSGAGLYVGLQVPLGTSARPPYQLPESLHQLLKAGSPQPPQTLRFILLSGQVA